MWLKSWLPAFLNVKAPPLPPLPPSPARRSLRPVRDVSILSNANDFAAGTATSSSLAVVVSNSSSADVYVRVEYGRLLAPALLQRVRSVGDVRTQLDLLNQRLLSATAHRVAPGQVVTIQPAADVASCPANATALSSVVWFAQRAELLDAVDRHKVPLEALGRITLDWGSRHVALRDVPQATAVATPARLAGLLLLRLRSTQTALLQHLRATHQRALPLLKGRNAMQADVKQRVLKTLRGAQVRAITELGRATTVRGDLERLVRLGPAALAKQSTARISDIKALIGRQPPRKWLAQMAAASSTSLTKATTWVKRTATVKTGAGATKAIAAQQLSAKQASDHSSTPQRQLLTLLSAWSAELPIAKAVRAECSDVSRHPELLQQARVRLYDPKSPAQSSDEADFVQRRRLGNARAFAKMFNLPLAEVHVDDVPIVGIAASGGGYRAMIAALGSIIGADDEGVLPCVTYVAGLSGSTWMLAQWLAQPSPDPRELRSAIMGRVSEDLLYVDSRTLDTFVTELTYKMAYNQDMTVVDAFGVLLATRLLPQLPGRSRLTLSDVARPIVEQASMPLPIFTAVGDVVTSTTTGQRSYLWMETTPFETGSTSLRAFVPTWGLGRAYSGGASVTSLPEMSLGFIMGTAGSAFCATAGDVWKTVVVKLRPTALRQTLAKFVHEELRYMKNHAVRPASVPNPTFGLDRSAYPHAAAPRLSMMDAGVHYNLPLLPLLRPDRAVDVVVLLDNSANVTNGIHLHDALEHARSKYPQRDWPKPDYPSLSHRPWSVVRSSDLSLMYLPLVANHQHSSFNPRQHLGAFGWLRTGNLKYSHDRVMQLSELTRFSFGECSPALRDELWRVYTAKAEARRRRLRTSS